MPKLPINISKGIHTANPNAHTPDGYYRDAENMVPDGSSLRTDRGHSLIPTPEGFVLVGECSIGDYKILLGHVDFISLVGILDTTTDIFETIVYRPGDTEDVLKTFEDVQVEGRSNWKGDRVIYFCPLNSQARRINLDEYDPATPQLEFDKQTALFVDHTVSVTEFVSESFSGEVPTGSYEISARFVTDSGAATEFGIPTMPIPIVASDTSANLESIQGDEPQSATGKAIKVNVSSIDTAFKYVQLAVLTYEELSNVPVVYLLPKSPINGLESMEMMYRGATDHEGTITLDEYITSGVAYRRFNLMAQKDNTLLVADLEETKIPDIDWFALASRITTRFVVKKIPYTESLQFNVENAVNPPSNVSEVSSTVNEEGYHTPGTCVSFKGYRRDEVYSFTITPVLTKGVLGPTIHIPANHSATTDATNDNINADFGGTMGTFVSTHKYPENAYPGIDSTDGLRLHKFPSARIQPIVSGNVEQGNLMIRVLGVEMSNIALTPEEELLYGDKIEGYIIGRLNRRGEETQLAQGIVKPLMPVAGGSDPAFTYNIALGDGFGHWVTRISSESGANFGTAYYNRSTSEWETEARPDLTSFGFVAPDIIHNLYSPEIGSRIKQCGIFTCDPYALDVFYSKDSLPATDEQSWERPFFKNVLGASDEDYVDDEVLLRSNRRTVRAFGASGQPHQDGGKLNTTFELDGQEIRMASSDGFLWLKTLNDGTTIHSKEHEVWGGSANSSKFMYMSYQVWESGQDNWDWREMKPVGTRTNFILHSLTRENSGQYGPLETQVSMFTQYIPKANFSGTQEFYNGDTFITKYGLTCNDEGYFGFAPNDDNNQSSKEGFAKPAWISGIVYFWLESDNNYSYRHYIQGDNASATELEGNTSSQPYFPAYRTLTNEGPPFGLLTLSAPNFYRPGYASQYNNQYSAQPTAKPYVVTPPEDVAIDESENLNNRIAYSAQSIQGEKADAFQFFGANNYYDVPLKHGVLTDIYVYKELYASTKETQWRLFYNTLATQATSAGDVVLGTGGAFNRPAVPLSDVDGGAGGLTHWLHGSNSAIGRFFVDQLQGKIFHLGSEGMAVISDDFADEQKDVIMSASRIVLGHEQKYNRTIFRLGIETLSYSYERRAFVSRHGYYPRRLLSHGPFMYGTQDTLSPGSLGAFYKMSTRNTAIYLGAYRDCNVTVSVRTDDSSKTLQSMRVVNLFKNSNNDLNNPYMTFNELSVWNDERYTGVNTLTVRTSAFQNPGILETFASKVEDGFRFSIPRDIVLDPSLPLFSSFNHRQVAWDTEKTKWLPRMRGNHFEVKLNLRSQSQGYLILHSLSMELTDNIR